MADNTQEKTEVPARDLPGLVVRYRTHPLVHLPWMVVGIIVGALVSSALSFVWWLFGGWQITCFFVTIIPAALPVLLSCMEEKRWTFWRFEKIPGPLCFDNEGVSVGNERFLYSDMILFSPGFRGLYIETRDGRRVRTSLRPLKDLQLDGKVSWAYKGAEEAAKRYALKRALELISAVGGPLGITLRQRPAHKFRMFYGLTFAICAGGIAVAAPFYIPHLKLPGLNVEGMLVALAGFGFSNGTCELELFFDPVLAPGVYLQRAFGKFVFKNVKRVQTYELTLSTCGWLTGAKLSPLAQRIAYDPSRKYVAGGERRSEVSIAVILIKLALEASGEQPQVKLP